jgi:outer membrane immunogenic protein
MLNSGTIILGLTLSSALALAPAKAADTYRSDGAGSLKDVPFVSVASWSGFYVGANGGFGWNGSSTPVKYDGPGTGGGDTFPAFQPEGGFGGGQIGYNWRRERVIFGVETDLQGSGISDNFHAFTPSRQIAARDNLDWFGTIRGRLGYAFDSSLIYVTGGFAYGQIDERIDVIPGTTGAFVQRNNVGTGFVMGAGMEYALSPAWSIKGEYQFIDLGSGNLTGFNTTSHLPRFTNDLDNTFHTVRIGLNYYAGAVYQPLK